MDVIYSIDIYSIYNLLERKRGRKTNKLKICGFFEKGNNDDGRNFVIKQEESYKETDC